jgi:hypothetical protein
MSRRGYNPGLLLAVFIPLFTMPAFWVVLCTHWAEGTIWRPVALVGWSAVSALISWFFASDRLLRMIRPRKP